MLFDVMRPLEGDILVRCFHTTPKSGAAASLVDLRRALGAAAGDTLAFRFAFHTAFMPPGGLLRLRRCDVDGWSESGGRFDDDFAVELAYEPLLPTRDGSLDSTRSIEPAAARPDDHASDEASPSSPEGDGRGVGANTKQGWLLKVGTVNTKPQRRWFVLRREKLTYWKDRIDTPPRGTILLADIRAIQMVPGETLSCYKFSIATRERTFILASDSDSDRADWMERLRAAAGI
jgi:hypothetical protein